jgi:putative transposase
MSSERANKMVNDVLIMTFDELITKYSVRELWVGIRFISLFYQQPYTSQDKLIQLLICYNINNNTMVELIRSSKSSLHEANTIKLDNLNSFIDEYRNVVSKFVDIIWPIDKLPKLLKKSITDQINNTWLSARAIQCAGKQASAIVRGTRAKQERRLFMIGELTRLGKFKQARKLQRIYDEATISKPDIQQVNPELDSRFVKIDMNNDTSFDGWITLTSLGNSLKIQLPFKKHKHFLKLESQGKMNKGVRLSKDNITFMFKIQNSAHLQKILDNKTGHIGIDVGQITTLTCSNGQAIQADLHGHTYQSICDKLARQKYESEAFLRTQVHRSNFLHWSVNQLNLTEIKTVNIEDIKGLKKQNQGKQSKSLVHWNYKELFDVLESKLNESGVQIHKVSPTYTSQRCSCCGWVRKTNRNGKSFVCGACGFTTDADYNGALNISLGLRAISKQERRQRRNRKGFYWLEVGQEHIVPDIRRVNSKTYKLA